MPFNYSDEGVEKRAGYTPIPAGDYLVKVISAVPGITKKGDDKVTVGYEVFEGEHKLKSIKNHTVTFFKDRKAKGAGMALDVLKALGQPWEGSFEVDPLRWIGRIVWATLSIEEYIKQDGTPGKSNKIKWLNEYDGPNKAEEESDPFS